MKTLSFFLLLGFFACWPRTLLAQVCNGGSYTITAQEAITCVPYFTNGIFGKELPNAGIGGPVDHLDSNSATVVSNLVSLGNYAAIATPGTDDYNPPLYYGTLAMPIYKINSCAGTCNGAGTYFHAPDGAEFSKSSDHFIRIWDQVSNQVIGIYNVSSLTPGCTATTNAQADADAECSEDFASGTGVQVTDYTADVDYQDGTIGHAGSTLESAGNSLTVRSNEWINGSIPHALYMHSDCWNLSVFPAPTSAATCGTAATRPPLGALFFLDYTDAEVDAMGLPAWKKTLVLALTHYGMYMGDGSGDVQGFQTLRFEGGEAYETAATVNPLYAWLETTMGLAPTTASAPNSLKRWVLGWLDGLTDLADHMHMADECVALGLAGMDGGCVSTPVPPPSTIVIDSTCNGQNSGASITFNCTVGTSTNRASLLFVSVGTTTSTSLTNANYNGDAFVNQCTAGGEGGGSAAFAHGMLLLNPDSGTHTVTVNLSDTPGAAAAVMINFHNVDQAVGFRAQNSNAGAGNSTSLSVTSVAGDLVVDGVYEWGASTLTPGTGQTAIYNSLLVGSPDPDYMRSSYKQADDTDTGMYYSFETSVTKWAECAFSLIPDPLTQPNFKNVFVSPVIR